MSDIQANLSDIHANLSDILANLSDIQANLSDIQANLSDIQANQSDIRPLTARYLGLTVPLIRDLVAVLIFNALFSNMGFTKTFL